MCETMCKYFTYTNLSQQLYELDAAVIPILLMCKLSKIAVKAGLGFKLSLTLAVHAVSILPK